MSEKFNQSHANKIISTIEHVESDRDEWKQQHENLLSVRQSDLQVITKLESELFACRKELEEAKAISKQKPFAYAGEYDINDIRDMRTVVYRDLSDFKTEGILPDSIYPLFKGEKL